MKGYKKFDIEPDNNTSATSPYKNNKSSHRQDKIKSNTLLKKFKSFCKARKYLTQDQASDVQVKQQKTIQSDDPSRIQIRRRPTVDYYKEFDFTRKYLKCYDSKGENMMKVQSKKQIEEQDSFQKLVQMMKEEPQ